MEGYGRTTRIEITVNDRELALIEKQSCEAGVSRTEYIRDMACYGRAQRDRRVAAMFVALMKQLCDAADGINGACYEIKKALNGDPDAALAELAKKYEELNERYDSLIGLYEDAFMDV